MNFDTTRTSRIEMPTPDKKRACAQVYPAPVATHRPQVALNNRPYNISETPVTPRLDLWNTIILPEQLKNLQKPLAPVHSCPAPEVSGLPGSARGGPR
jgi:hypothetical protein